MTAAGSPYEGSGCVVIVPTVRAAPRHALDRLENHAPVRGALSSMPPENAHNLRYHNIPDIPTTPAKPPDSDNRQAVRPAIHPAARNPSGTATPDSNPAQSTVFEPAVSHHTAPPSPPTQQLPASVRHTAPSPNRQPYTTAPPAAAGIPPRRFRPGSRPNHEAAALILRQRPEPCGQPPQDTKKHPRPEDRRCE